MRATLDAFLAQFSREAREMTLCLRDLIFSVFPHVVEQIDFKNGLITYGFDKTDKSQVFNIVVHMKYIILIFSKGAQISDPSYLLSGTGKFVRHIKIRAES